jgi:translation initiation factor eIF-2B subunit delta
MIWLASAVEEIRKDKIHGASYLAGKALDILKDAARFSQAGSPEEFLEEMARLAGKLIKCRPAMVPIGNLAFRFLDQVQEYDGGSADLDSLRSFLLAAVDKMKAEFQQARVKAIAIGAGLIAAADTIITVSYSSTVAEAMAQARKAGQCFKVMAARSQARPGAVAYGERMAAALAGHGVECLLFDDEHIEARTGQADKAIIGADCILPDGSLLNGCPTGRLALAAQKENIPLYSICESSKFSRSRRLDSIEEGFDLVAPDLITGIAWEKGLLETPPVSAIIRSK